MSGTINHDMFRFQLGLKEGVDIKTFQYDSEKRNMKTMLISKGINGNELTTVYNNRNNKKMVIDYGKTLIHLLRNTQESGSLVFFTSDELKKQWMNIWIENNLIVRKTGELGYSLFDRETGKYIPIYNDTTGENSINENSNVVISEYKKNAINKKIVLFSCFRGKASEGEDYPNGEVRSVFIIGIPLANVTDIIVKRKIDYLNSIEDGKGWDWLMVDAINAVNQAIGRMIRDIRKDYGVAYLMDSRYSKDPKILSYFSNWIKESIIPSEITMNIKEMSKLCKTFFDENGNKKASKTI